ncbi:hypothetical protein [Clostridium kluyveri]|nr:hypothetical protein [Clostridium kluyveri]
MNLLSLQQIQFEAEKLELELSIEYNKDTFLQKIYDFILDLNSKDSPN